MRKFLFSVLLLLFLSACENPLATTATPTPGTNLAGLVGTAVYVKAENALDTPTQLPPGIVPTREPPSAADLAATVAWAGISAQMTQQAANLQMEHAQATETSEAARANATQVAGASATAEYWKGMAWSATLTAAPQETGTAYPATATSYAWTQAAIPAQATNNQAGLYAQETVVGGQAEGMAMAVDKQKWAGTGNTLIEWGGIFAVLIIIGFYVYKMTKYMKMADGVYSVEGANGKKQVIHTGRMSTPVLTLNPETNSAEAGGMVDEEFQRETTRGAQKVEALNAMPQTSNNNPERLFSFLARFLGRPTPVNINVITPKEDEIRELEGGLSDE